MSLKKFQRGQTWYIRGSVAGQKVYESSGTSDPEKAQQKLEKLQHDLWQGHIYGDKVVVTFSDAVLSYLESHPDESEQDKKNIKRVLDFFHKYKLKDIDQSLLDKSYKAIFNENVKWVTKDRVVLSQLNKILNHANKRGWCDKPNFERDKLSPSKTRWITPDEAETLINVSADHLKPILILMFCTGARVSEAIYLNTISIDIYEETVIYMDTKNNRNRVAALPSAALDVLTRVHNRSGQAFVARSGKPYKYNNKEYGGQIDTAFKTACRNANIEDFTPHDIRHTWATWFYALTKDLLLLKKEGDWQSVSMVERYAHLMPTKYADNITKVWGKSHPLIGVLPTPKCAKSVQFKT